MKRTHEEIRRAVLKVLSDNKLHSYGDLERRVNTNWRTIRDHCEDLKLFNAVTISKDNRIKITKLGRDVLKRIT